VRDRRRSVRNVGDHGARRVIGAGATAGASSSGAFGTATTGFPNTFAMSCFESDAISGKAS